jgi:Holliday junction resolvase RusA-like endonuclease
MKSAIKSTRDRWALEAAGLVELPIQSHRVAIATVVELPGEPQGKLRPRFTRRGFAYTPAKTRVYEAALAGAARVAMGRQKPMDGPLIVLVGAFMRVPASWNGKKRDAALAGAIAPTGRPDWDNLAKVCDALNGIVWIDDSQIVQGHVTKQYSESPRLRIEVRRLDPPLFSEDSDAATHQVRLRPSL